MVIDALPVESPQCPACIAKRLHSESEWEAFHPMRGHGYTREQGWTHPALKPANAGPNEATSAAPEAKENAR